VARRYGLVVLAAVIAFLVAQDRGTSAGVGRYLEAQRAALAGRGPRVTVDEVMGPANREAVKLGLAWGAGVAVAGLAGVSVLSRRPRRG
jgi:hypothetical protein